MTKSGHSGRNLSFCSAVSVRNRSRRTHAASGARVAPLGRTKPPEESKATPVPSRSVHAVSRWVKMALRLLVPPPAGGMISRSPSAVRSMRQSLFSWQNSKNCRSSISTAGRVWSTSGGYPAWVKASFIRNDLIIVSAALKDSGQQKAGP